MQNTCFGVKYMGSWVDSLGPRHPDFIYPNNSLKTYNIQRNLMTNEAGVSNQYRFSFHLSSPYSPPPTPKHCLFGLSVMSRGLFIPFKPLFPVIQAIYKKGPSCLEREETIRNKREIFLKGEAERWCSNLSSKAIFWTSLLIKPICGTSIKDS